MGEPLLPHKTFICFNLRTLMSQETYKGYPDWPQSRALSCKRVSRLQKKPRQDQTTLLEANKTY